MAERDDLNVPMIATVGVISVTLTVAIVFAVQALYFNYANRETQRKVVQAPTVDSNSRLAEQEAKLQRYSWVSKENGTVTIPVERAMSLVVRELGAQDTRHGNGRSPKKKHFTDDEVK